MSASPRVAVVCKSLTRSKRSYASFHMTSVPQALRWHGVCNVALWTSNVMRPAEILEDHQGFEGFSQLATATCLSQTCSCENGRLFISAVKNGYAGARCDQTSAASASNHSVF